MSQKSIKTEEAINENNYDNNEKSAKNEESDDNSEKSENDNSENDDMSIDGDMSDSDSDDEVEDKKIMREIIIDKTILDENKKIDMKCIYHNIKKSDQKEIFINVTKIYVYKPKKGESDKRLTKKRLYHYEKVKMIGDRIVQLDNGAKPMIKNIKGLTSEKIAIAELETEIEYTTNDGIKVKTRSLPFKLHRELPNNIIEVFDIGELF
jgi:DNA-directed RNA polymerase subunit K/omega